MTLEEARNAFIDAAQRTMEAYRTLEAAKAAESKAREAFRVLLDKHNESLPNG